jgi:hypothetical protein
MTDNQPPNRPPAKPPELFTIPTQLLEEWVDVPTHDHINITLTRQDLDHLFFGLTRLAEAQGKLDAVMVLWSNNDVDNSNIALGEFRRLNVESQNHIRQFITAMMFSALRERKK